MRLLTLKHISSPQFISERDKLREEFTAREAKKKEKVESGEEKGGFGILLDKKSVAEKGAGYVALVLENVRKGHISNSDALDYLDANFCHARSTEQILALMRSNQATA